MTVVVAVLAGVGCSGDDDDAATATDDAGDAAEEGGATDAGGGGAGADTGGPTVLAVDRAAQLVSAGRSVIRTAEVEVEVDDLDAAVRRAVSVAEGAGGYLAEEQTTLGDDPTSRVVLKVAPDRFTAALDDLSRLGEVVRKQVGSDDVTDVVVDLEGRLAATTASVVRLRELLASAGNVPEVVSVESELARREGELEALTGQLRVLESQVDLATVTMVISEVVAAGSPSVNDDIPGFLAGLRTGWVAFVNVAGGVATVAGFALPFLAVAAVVAVPLLRRRGGRRPAAGVS